MSAIITVKKEFDADESDTNGKLTDGTIPPYGLPSNIKIQDLAKAVTSSSYKNVPLRTLPCISLTILKASFLVSYQVLFYIIPNENTSWLCPFNSRRMDQILCREHNHLVETAWSHVLLKFAHNTHHFPSWTFQAIRKQMLLSRWIPRFPSHRRRIWSTYSNFLLRSI